MLWESIISSVKYLLGLFIIAIASGCAPRPPRPALSEPQKELPSPYDFRAEIDNHRATLFWLIDRSKTLPTSGYNIYLGDNSAIQDTSAWACNPGKPINQIPYPGDTDGDIDRESFPLEHLDNGRTYYALVRTVGPDGRESGSSNLAIFTPIAHGEFIISTNHEAPNGGFNFELETQLPGRDPRSDIYLYATQLKVGLSAPNRLGGGLRKTKFSDPIAGIPVETIQILKGQSISIFTKAGQADIKIEDIIGIYPDISARISYVFRPDKPQ